MELPVGARNLRGRGGIVLLFIQANLCSRDDIQVQGGRAWRTPVPKYVTSIKSDADSDEDWSICTRLTGLQRPGAALGRTVESNLLSPRDPICVARVWTRAAMQVPSSKQSNKVKTIPAEEALIWYMCSLLIARH